MDINYAIVFTTLTLIILFSGTSAIVEPISVVTAQDGSYVISVKGVAWLHSAPPFFTVDGTRYSASDGSLVLEKVTSQAYGLGKLGAHVDTDLYYTAGNVSIVASVVYYAGEMLSFRVRFESEVNATNQECLDQIICGFPGFRTDSSEKLGFLSLGGTDVGFEKQTTGRWMPGADIQDGLEASSALTLFDTNYNAVTFGPLDNFLSTSMWHDHDGNFLYWGTMGGVAKLQANFTYQIFAVMSPQGVPNSFSLFGFVLLSLYYTDRRPPDSSAKGIGYWTDSEYFLSDNSSINYEDVLIEVFADGARNNLTYSYVEWDTWWFIKGSGGGVKEWSPPIDVFPHGEQSIQQKLKVPVFAKNSFWSSNNIYAKQNGGNFSFVIEGDMALPLDEAFWDHIFTESRKWGLVTYIQDNMADIFRNFPQMTSDPDFCRDWLVKMARAAGRHNITIQYSGALSKMALEALELPAVTRVRISSENATHDVWNLGVTSMYGSLLDISVFTGSLHTLDQSAELASIIASLTGGLVAIGDQPFHQNNTLIKRICMEDGTILSPNIGATATHAQLSQLAFQNGEGPDGQLWSTKSSVYSGDPDNVLTHGVILVSGLTSPFKITPLNTGLNYTFPKSKIFCRKDPGALNDFSYDTSFQLPLVADYELYYTSPVLSLGQDEVVILGELSKWIPMSRERTRNVTMTEEEISILLKGQTGEQVEIWYSYNANLTSQATEISSTGYNTIVIKNRSPSIPTSTPPPIGSGTRSDVTMFLILMTCVRTLVLAQNTV